MSSSDTSIVQRLRQRFARAWRRSRRLVLAVLVLAVLLLAARVALPIVLRNAINQRLTQIPDYAGRVVDVDVALWRGGYVLRDVLITKKGGDEGEPFFSAQLIDFSLAWREIFRGRIVSDIHTEGAQLNFVKAPSNEASQLTVDRRWQDVIQDIFPIDITYFDINGGRLRYVDRTRTPQVDVFVEDLRAVVTGLRNRPGEKGEELPARLTLSGDTIGQGRLMINGVAEPLAAQPTFEFRVTLERVSLPSLNDWLRSFARVDVASGTFQFYFEMAAKDGRFQGYAKPFFSQVNFNVLGDSDKNLLEKAWEMIASGLVRLLKNKDRDELAMRVPFAGEFGQTQVGVWATITSVLRNGFVEALPPALERTIKATTIPPPGQPVSLPAPPSSDPDKKETPATPPPNGRSPEAPAADVPKR